MLRCVGRVASSAEFYIAASTFFFGEMLTARSGKQNAALMQQNQQLNKALLWQQNQLALLGQDVFQSSR